MINILILVSGRRGTYYDPLARYANRADYGGGRPTG